MVISTDCSRPEKLLDCISSIQKNSYRHTLLVLQQSSKLISLPIGVLTRQIPKKGVSFSKNIGLKMCRTDLIAFTDDDCLVDPHWLERLVKSFSDPTIVGVYGSVIPYPKTRLPELTCPSYMLKTKKTVVKSFNLNRTHYGIGCNMAFRTHPLIELGGFTTWLSPGTPGQAAEDVELIFRLLTRHYALLYDPSIIIFHNRWLTNNQNRSQYRRYYIGTLAAYSYHMLKGSLWGRRATFHFWIEKITSLLHQFRLLPHHPGLTLKNLFYDVWDIICFKLGMCLGLYHFLTDKPEKRQL